LLENRCSICLDLLDLFTLIRIRMRCAFLVVYICLVDSG
jgi:hypothetical protein